MRIKKISPTTPANGNIEDAYGTSQTNAYSEAYVNSKLAEKLDATGTAVNSTKWDGKINDLNTENNNDTWIPVLNGNKIQHTTVSNIVSKGTSDTGWVDLSSYLNSTYFTIRPGFTPKARKIGNVVYLKGSIYCSTAPNTQTANILTNIPNQFRPPEEVLGTGKHHNQSRVYNIFCAEGNITVNEGENIETTQYYGGFSLSCLSGYLVD